MSIPNSGGTGPLNLLIDSSGIKAEGEGERNARKHGGSKRRIWRNIHIRNDEQTLEVRAVEVTGSNIGDVPMLPELLDQIPPEQEIGSVMPDSAYDPRKCHEAIAARGAAAVIPPRKNAKPLETDEPQAPSHTTRPCGPRSPWAAPSGDDGADTTDGAGSKQR